MAVEGTPTSYGKQWSSASFVEPQKKVPESTNEAQEDHMVVDIETRAEYKPFENPESYEEGGEEYEGNGRSAVCFALVSNRGIACGRRYVYGHCYSQLLAICTSGPVEKALL